MTSIASGTGLKRCVYNGFRVLYGGKYIAGIDHNRSIFCSNNCVYSDSRKPRICRRLSSKPHEDIPQRSNMLIGEVINSSVIRKNGDFVKYSTIPQQQNLKLEKFISVLCLNGFSTGDCVEMAAKCPEVIECTESQLSEVLSSFRRCKYNNEDILSILKSCPQHFCAFPNLIISRYFSLIDIFSHNLIRQIFSNCPGIMFFNWKDIQGKIEYLKNVMVIQNREIAFSSALQFPLDILKARHMFLERAGMFKTVDPKSATPTKNPRLKNIINGDEMYFAEKVAGLTLEEYHVFLELQSNNEEDNYEESDDEIEDIDEH